MSDNQGGSNSIRLGYTEVETRITTTRLRSKTIRSSYVPSGEIEYIDHKGDNLVLELVLGRILCHDIAKINEEKLVLDKVVRI